MRAERRHHEKRIKARAFRQMRSLRMVLDDKRVGKWSHAAASCSCSMCCNPRHAPYSKGSHRLTLQERKFEEACCG